MESKIQQLLDWSLENGSLIDSSLEFKYAEARGVYAISTINQTTPALTPQLQIPLDLIIRSELSDKYFGIDNDKLTNPNGALKLLLAKLKYDIEPLMSDGKNLTEFFRPYIDLLPLGKQTNSPFYWNSNELKLLQNTNLGGSLPMKLKVILEEWKTTIDLLPSSFKEHTEEGLKLYERFNVLSHDDLVESLLDIKNWTSFGAYLWASIIFTSRAFPHHIIDSNSKDGQAILLPLVDLLNHDNSTRVNWAFENNSKGQFFTLHNNEVLSLGQEVSNNYGAKGNEELLMGYGFAVESNSNDSIALRVKIPLDSIKQAESYGVCIPKLDDYTHHAFLSKDKHDGDKGTITEDLKDGLLFFINRSNLLPENLLHLFSFLVKTPDEGARTLRADLSALQNLRKALEHKQTLLKQDIQGVDVVSIDPYIHKIAEIYRKGQRDLHKLALSAIKSKEKSLLQDFKTNLLTLKKIYKRDTRLSSLLEQFGFDNYERIEADDYTDVVLFLWLILNSDISNSEENGYQPPNWLVNSYKKIQSSEYQSDGAFAPLYQSLKGVLQQTPLSSFVTERNIAIASEVIAQNSYVRVSNNEIILVEPVSI